MREPFLMFKEPWAPKSLLEYFDPTETYLKGAEPAFRDTSGNVLLRGDDIVELLFFGYSLLRRMGGPDLISESRLKKLHQRALEIVRAESTLFDFNAYSNRESKRIHDLTVDGFSFGSAGEMILHNFLEGAREKNSELVPEQDRPLWGFLALIWLDRSIGALKGNDAREAVQTLLRANHFLKFVGSEQTEKELLSEFSRMRLKKKREKNTVLRLRPEVKSRWESMRSDPRFTSKISMTRAIQDDFPDITDPRTFGRWFLEFEREEESRN